MGKWSWAKSREPRGYAEIPIHRLALDIRSPYLPSKGEAASEGWNQRVREMALAVRGGGYDAASPRPLSR